MPEQNFTRASAILLKTAGVPDINTDTPVVETFTDAGEKLTLNLGGTTGTVYTHARWVSLEEIKAGIS
jgi:hypothetical protein